jgi:hypothetical protein
MDKAPTEPRALRELMLAEDKVSPRILLKVHHKIHALYMNSMSDLYICNKLLHCRQCAITYCHIMYSVYIFGLPQSTFVVLFSWIG